MRIAAADRAGRKRRAGAAAAHPPPPLLRCVGTALTAALYSLWRRHADPRLRHRPNYYARSPHPPRWADGATEPPRSANVRSQTKRVTAHGRGAPRSASLWCAAANACHRPPGPVQSTRHTTRRSWNTLRCVATEAAAVVGVSRQSSTPNFCQPNPRHVRYEGFARERPRARFVQCANYRSMLLPMRRLEACTGPHPW